MCPNQEFLTIMHESSFKIIQFDLHILIRGEFVPSLCIISRGLERNEPTMITPLRRQFPHSCTCLSGPLPDERQSPSYKINKITKSTRSSGPLLGSIRVVL